MDENIISCVNSFQLTDWFDSQPAEGETSDSPSSYNATIHGTIRDYSTGYSY
jgi:hypothetical protein